MFSFSPARRPLLSAPSSSELSSDAASTSVASDKLPHIRYTKRRIVHEIPSRERWCCPNSPCQLEYKRTSSISIARHKQTCRWQSSTAANVILDTSTVYSLAPVNVRLGQRHLNSRNSRQPTRKAQHPRCLLDQSRLPQPSSAAITKMDNASEAGDGQRDASQPVYHSPPVDSRPQWPSGQEGAVQPPKKMFRSSP